MPRITLLDGHELIYGRNPVLEAQRGRRAVHQVWESPEFDSDSLTEMVDSPDHQGIVAEVDAYPYADPTTLLAAEGAFVIALDQVQDPRNLGAVARSAEAAGAAGLVITERRAASVTAVACKASAGAVEHLPIARVRNLADWMASARDAGAWLYGADADSPTSYTGIDMTGRLVLLLGGEGSGLRPRVAESCDGLVSIPLRGKVDSLNVSAAAAVLAFEAARVRA